MHVIKYTHEFENFAWIFRFGIIDAVAIIIYLNMSLIGIKSGNLRLL